MIDKNTFKKTESRLYRYYRNIKEIDKLEYKCTVLENQKEELKQDIRQANISIEPDLNMGIDYSVERVQASPTECSYVERETIKQIEKLEQEWKRTRRNILQLHAKIREIKKQNADMEYIVGLLSTEYKFLSELKYRECLSLEEIGEKLNMAKSTASRTSERIVKHVAKMLKG